ncbi:MAG: carbon-nitrogen hydrolase family protein [Thermomicrobiales bacterium]
MSTTTTTNLTVALLQMVAHGNDIAANQEKGDAFCRRAKLMGADIALFPEMWSAGYTPASAFPENDPNADVYRAPQVWSREAESESESDPAIPALDDVWRGLAIGRDHPFIRHFRDLAVELEMAVAIAITYLEAWEGSPRNTMSLIDRHGEIVLTYAKVHTCAFSPHEASLTPGDGFDVATLDTAQGPVEVGAMICYDREFPESARILMMEGVEIILNPNACDMNAHRLTQLRARAYENMVGIAMANMAGPAFGHSTACDGVCFTVDGYRDSLVIEAGEAEGVYPVIFDLDAMREYRLRETWGNAFRRPDRYAVLTSSEVRDPFVRVDSDGNPHRRDR